MTLQPKTSLQGGRYRILSVLGQGGFGITYLAEQTLLDGKVAIKEFFMKELCERDESTSHVTLGTSSNREMVERCRQKFLKEARTIFRLNHPNIVRILDVFEENGTAYYVMDYIEGESLADMVKRRGALPEAEALNYIKEVGKALMYIHDRKLNHLDIKPSNIMRREEDGRIMLIDFGVSKQYDLVTSEGTSTTPVGISRGYSPAEQYRQHGVQTFSPQSDVYALAATLFKLLTGVTPPEAMEVLDGGLPIDELQARHISASVITAIQRAMKGRLERTQSIAAFLSALDDKAGGDSEVTEVINANPVGTDSKPKPDQQPFSVPPMEPKLHPDSTPKPTSTLKIIGGIAAAVLIGVLAVLLGRNDNVGELGHSGTEEQRIVTVGSNPTQDKQTFTVNGVRFTMVRVDGGSFKMGATSEQGSDAYDDEKPAHQVTLSTYSIGETEVTQELWEAVMGSNPSNFKGSKRPVERVSWNDCQDFIRKLNAATGRSFRLPTEAEWEYAARGGNRSRGYKYSGSNTLGDVAWYDDNSGDQTHNVATKQSNELGLYDMSGNVWEWCSGGYGSYSSSAQRDPEGPNSGSSRVIRGGSWGYYARYCRSSFRDGHAPDRCYNFLGLRLALSE